jgi:hypothetical protein
MRCVVLERKFLGDLADDPRQRLMELRIQIACRSSVCTGQSAQIIEGMTIDSPVTQRCSSESDLRGWTACAEVIPSVSRPDSLMWPLLQQYAHSRLCLLHALEHFTLQEIEICQ